ncbi:MAG: hypothetical protein GKR94_19215 [Gammaproteobacteria bacterium]|nr:hypothetical protein [Gammaproteobacteria bacterium]
MSGTGETEVDQSKRRPNILAVTLTALVSVATVAISGVQVWVANIQKGAELEVKREEADRAWRIKAAEFILENKKIIFGSQESRERDQLLRVFSYAFPAEIADSLVEEITDENRLRNLLCANDACSKLNEEGLSKVRACQSKLGLENIFLLDLVLRPAHRRERQKLGRCVQE